MKDWLVYLLECSDSTFYCGITNNLKKRVKNHNAGRGARYTKTRAPVRVIGYKKGLTRSEAIKLERRVKRLSRAKKQEFFMNNFLYPKKLIN